MRELIIKAIKERRKPWLVVVARNANKVKWGGFTISDIIIKKGRYEL